MWENVFGRWMMELDKNIKVYKLYEKEGRIEYFNNFFYIVNTEYQDKDSNGIVTNKGETKSGQYIYLQYREIRLSEIKEMFLSGEKINLTGKYISNFDIDKLNLPREFQLNVDFIADFSYWNGDTNFKGFDFGKGDVDFRFSKFVKGDVSFAYANFGEGNVIFKSANFGKGELFFTGANFGKGNVSFSHLNFGEGNVRFNCSNFGEGDVSFKRAKFGEGDVSFGYVNFDKGNIDFSGADFGEGNVRFNYSNFGEGDASFRRANFGEGDVDFADVNFGEGDVSFNYTNFGDGDISFWGASADIVSIIGSKFTNDINMQFDSINCLLINSCTNKQHMQITGVQEKLSFYRSTNLGRIEIDWDKCNLKKAIPYAYLAEKNEREFDFYRLNKMTQKEKYSHIAHDFLLLKENYRNIGNYEWEDETYYHYMKYRTKSMSCKKDFWKIVFNKIFGGISGYGTRPLRVALWCIVTFLFSAVIYDFTTVIAHLKSGGIFANLGDSLYFSAITFLTIGYSEIMPSHWLIKTVSSIEGFFGLLLMSVLAVTIMRKVLR